MTLLRDHDGEGDSAGRFGEPLDGFGDEGGVSDASGVEECEPSGAEDGCDVSTWCSRVPNLAAVFSMVSAAVSNFLVNCSIC